MNSTVPVREPLVLSLSGHSPYENNVSKNRLPALVFSSVIFARLIACAHHIITSRNAEQREKAALSGQPHRSYIHLSMYGTLTTLTCDSSLQLRICSRLNPSDIGSLYTLIACDHVKLNSFIFFQLFVTVHSDSRKMYKYVITLGI